MTLPRKGRGQRLMIFLIIAILIMILFDRVIFPGWFPGPLKDSVKQNSEETSVMETGQRFQMRSQGVTLKTPDNGNLDPVTRSEIVSTAHPPETAGAEMFAFAEKPAGETEILDERKFMPFQTWLEQHRQDISRKILQKAARLQKLNLNHRETTPDLPPWKRYAVKIPRQITQANSPRVVIIIDDLGERKNITRKFYDLPGPLTLSFLPYVEDVQNMMNAARARQHETMLHIPMEPLSQSIQSGPGTLKTGMSTEELIKTLNFNLDKANGYVGVNNHMGSKLTQDPEAMNVVMGTLRDRGLLFVDSKTIAGSVAHDYSVLNGVPGEVRDVFIDHEATPDFINAALASIEQKAFEHGTIIAIGHPYPQTYKALAQWLPTLQGKGITITPISAVVSQPQTLTAENDKGPGRNIVSKAENTLN